MNRAEAHKILGTSPGISEEELKKVWRNRASKLHPDKSGFKEDSPEWFQRNKDFQQMKEAYEFLESGKSDPYEQPRSSSHTESYWSESSPEDIYREFNSFKRNGRPPPGDISENYADNWNASGPGARNRNQSRIINATISITLEEAFTGCDKSISVPDARSIAGTMVSIKIPPGCGEHEPVRVIEAHEATVKVYVHITSDYKINWGYDDSTKRGDILKSIRISPFVMMLGGFMEIPTIEGGKVSVRVPAGLNPNSLLKIKGKGYWSSTQAYYRGDCYLRVIPNIQKLEDINPKQLDDFIAEIKGRREAAK